MTPTVNDNSLKIGGRTFAVRPLSLKKLKGLLPTIQRFNGNLLQETQIDDLVSIAQATLFDAEGTGATADFLEEHITVDTVTLLFEQIARASGLVPRRAAFTAPVGSEPLKEGTESKGEAPSP